MHPNLHADRRNTPELSDANTPMTLGQKLVVIAPWAALLVIGILMVS